MSTIHYQDSADGIAAAQLEGFFEGWPNPPSPDVHLELLRGSDEIVLAVDRESGSVVGFVTALTDRVLCAYISLLEVRADARRQGIGSELVRRLMQKLGSLYMVDLLCDEDVRPFYGALGLEPMTGMMRRNFEAQSGVSKSTGRERRRGRNTGEGQ